MINRLTCQPLTAHTQVDRDIMNVEHIRIVRQFAQQCVQWRRMAESTGVTNDVSNGLAILLENTTSSWKSSSRSRNTASSSV